MPDDRLLVGAVGLSADGGQFDQRELVMLDWPSGAVIWRGKRPSAQDGAYTVVDVAAGKVVLQLSRAGRTVWLAIALDSGVTLWEHRLEADAIAALDGSRSRLLIAAKGLLRAIDLGRGKTLWEHSFTPRAASVVPTVTSSDTMVCLAASDVACIDSVSGRELWRKPASDDQAVVAARLVGGTLLVGTDAGLSAWNTANGGIRWWRSAHGKGLLSADVEGDTVYAMSVDSAARTAKVTTLALSTGEVRWTSDKLPPPRGPLCVTADTVYVSTAAVLFALDAATGVRAARAPLPFALVRNLRSPDRVRVDASTVTVVTERGAALYRRDSLELEATAFLNGANTWGDARSLLALSTNPNPVARTRALVRWSPLYDSAGERASSEVADGAIGVGEKAATISEVKAAMHAERVSAALGMGRTGTYSFAGALLAPGAELRRREATDTIMMRYSATATDLRLDGTPPGFALASTPRALVVFDPERRATAQIPHSSELMMGWQHVAAITPDATHVVGVHVPIEGVAGTTAPNGALERQHLVVESYALDAAAWRPAEPLPPQDALTEDVREGRIHSLRERFALPECYGVVGIAGRSFQELHDAAFLGNNRAMLRELEAEAAWRSTVTWDVEHADIAAALDMPAIAEDKQALSKRLADEAELGLLLANDDVAAAKALLDRGVRPNGASAASTKRSCWPVPLAASRSTTMSELLLARGAAVNLVDGEGKTALDHHMKANHEANVAYLRQRGGKTAAELGVKP